MVMFMCKKFASLWKSILLLSFSFDRLRKSVRFCFPVNLCIISCFLVGFCFCFHACFPRLIPLYKFECMYIVQVD